MAMVIVHIGLTILKVLGILLLILLGLILLILLVILFVPIRYQVSADMPRNDLKKAHGTVNVTYLLKLLAVKAEYLDEKLHWHLRIAWLHFGSDVEKKQKKKKQKKAGEVKHTSKEPAKIEEKKEEPVAKAAQTEETVPVPDKPENQNLEQPEEKQPEEKKPEEEKALAKPPKENKKRTKRDKKEKKEKKEKKQGPTLEERIDAGAEKVKSVFSSICDKLSAADEKKNKVTDFLGNPVHQKGIKKILKELRWVVSFLKPKKAEGRICYGLEDPCTTGQVLAAVSILYPFTGGALEIEPDFEEKVIEGEVTVDGSLRFYKLAAMLLFLVISGPVRKLVFDGIKFGKNF